MRWILGQANLYGRGDTEHTFAADKGTAKVERRARGVERNDGPVGEHDLDRHNVGGGDARRQAMRAAGVVADVAADGATLLARRVGREMKTVTSRRTAEVGVQHAGFDPGGTSDRIDLTDPIHRHHRHDNCAVGWNRSPRETGARSARHEGHVPASAIRHDADHVVEATGHEQSPCGAGDVRRIARHEMQLVGLCRQRRLVTHRGKITDSR